MFFLIQSNIYHDPDHERIFEALNDLGIDYETTITNPKSEKIDYESDRKDIFVYGSVSLARLAKQKDWYPGSFYGGNHLYEIYSKYYGENLLNNKIKVQKISEKFEWKNGEKKFIKPYKNAKIFTGKVYSEYEWKDFVVDALKSTSNNINKDSLIQISEVKEILKEARLWIVGGQIIDAGYYKFSENINFEMHVSDEGINFAKKMINIFNVEEAFVMDICLTIEGWKIVEVNCINSSGFYPNTNVKSIVKALNIYFSK